MNSFITDWAQDWALKHDILWRIDDVVFWKGDALLFGMNKKYEQKVYRLSFSNQENREFNVEEVNI